MRLEKDWITAAGLRAVVVIAEFEAGVAHHRCGYVGVDSDSKLWDKEYSEQLDCINQETVDTTELGENGAITIFTAGCGSDGEGIVRRSLDIAIDCHGGLTYSGGGLGSEYPVVSNLWWFGFDCAHYGDANIELTDTDRKYYTGGTVRTFEFCELQCEKIAVQLVALERGSKLSQPAQLLLETKEPK